MPFPFSLFPSAKQEPLHLSRILYKSPIFFAKQTQFSGGQNERKDVFYKEL